MAAPYDYSVQAPDITGSIMGGIQAGQQLRSNQDALAAREASMAKQEQYAADMQNYLSAPSASNASAMIAKYPEFQKSLSASFDIYDKGQKDEIFKSGTQAYSAIQNGKPEVAKKILDDRIAAFENSGQDTKDLLDLRRQLDSDPKAVASGLALTMSALKPDDWGKISTELRETAKAPAELSLAESKAAKAATDAKFAESSAVQDLAKGGWEIQKLANDINISKLNSQIAAMNAATSRQANDIKSQGNNLKQQELQLKLQEKIDKRDAAINEKVSTVQSGRSTIDNFLNTADKVVNTPAGVVRSATGTISSRLPTVDQDVADFEETLKTLGSQAFLSQVPSMKGLGALTEAEGKKLESSLANLSLRQSPEKLIENVKEAQRLMLKARATLSDRYGVPDVTPDTPAAAPTPTGIDALLQKYGGAQ
jgi:hypothetical protein